MSKWENLTLSMKENEDYCLDQNLPTPPPHPRKVHLNPTENKLAIAKLPCRFPWDLSLANILSIGT